MYNLPKRLRVDLNIVNSICVNLALVLKGDLASEVVIGFVSVYGARLFLSRTSYFLTLHHFQKLKHPERFSSTKIREHDFLVLQLEIFIAFDP